MKSPRRFLPALLYLGLFAWGIFRFEDFAALLEPWAPGKALFVERETLPVLALQHLVLVLATSASSLVVALLLGFVSSLERGREWRRLLDRLAAFGETFPSMALIALLVPSLGYGVAPVALALFLYGLLPIFRATWTGLRQTAPDLVEAAKGVGMDEVQVLLRLRLPLALPLVAQGFRVALVSNIAAATLGATVGAGGLGVPILSGIRSFDPLLILKGALPLAFLALGVDSLLRAIERSPRFDLLRA